MVARFCERLDIRGIIDRACPIRHVAIITHGWVIETLIANRLTSPAPLVHVQQWAEAWAVVEIFGVEASVLNDDRVGRALDAPDATASTPAGLRLVPATANAPPIVPAPTGLKALILEVLEIDPITTR